MKKLTIYRCYAGLKREMLVEKELQELPFEMELISIREHDGTWFAIKLE